MKSLLITFGFFSVLILGLSSCTSKSSGDAPDDTWRIHQPTIQSAQWKVNFKESEGRNLPFDSELVFDKSDMKGVELAVVTTCSFEGSRDRAPYSASTTFLLHDPLRIKISSLVAREIFEKINPSDIEALSCALDFEATNSLRSKQHFIKTNIGFASLNETGGLKLTVKSPGDVNLVPIEEVGDVADVDLICENFMSRVVVRDSSEIASAVSELMAGNLNPHMTSAKTPYDPRQLHPIQQCYFYIATTGKDLLPQYLLSERKLFQFTLPKLETTYALGMRYLNAVNMNDQSILTISAKNLGRAPVAVRFPKQPGGNVHLQPVAWNLTGDSLFHPGHILLAPTKTVATGSSRTIDSDLYSIFVIEPGTTLELRIAFQTDVTCMKRIGEIDWPNHKFMDNEASGYAALAPIGFLYGFEQPFQLERYVDFNSDTGTGELQVTNTFDQSIVHGNDQLPGWLPHEIAFQKFKDGALPELGKEQSMGSCEKPGNNYPSSYNPNEVY